MIAAKLEVRGNLEKGCMVTLVPKSQGQDDQGMVTIFVIGCLVFVLGLVFVVASASAIHLERKQLAAAADALAISAANAHVADDFFESGGTVEGSRQLSQPEVERAVDDHLAANPHVLDGLNVTNIEVFVRGGDTAVVRLQAHVHPPFTGGILEKWSEGFSISVESRARAW